MLTVSSRLEICAIPYNTVSADNVTRRGKTNIRNPRGGSFKATILPKAIILTKAHRAAVSMMVNGSIVA